MKLNQRTMHEVHSWPLARLHLIRIRQYNGTPIPTAANRQQLQLSLI
jgi:hypothetical protein